MSGINDEELHEAEYVPSIRQKIGEAAFDMTLGLLFFAQDGSGGERGSDKWSKADEQERIANGRWMDPNSQEYKDIKSYRDSLRK